MQRVLIVEDNQTLAKLIGKKIKNELGVEVDFAFSMAEAKLFLAAHSYFVALLDLNLPDAPNGEIVDFALEKKNRVIVLSGNIDKATRERLVKSDIIDYVKKSGVEDIHFIIDEIRRLQKNQNHTILVVDDSLVFRKNLQTLLENMFFKVITVAHGEEALGILSNNHDITLVITDFHMPVMDGLELTKEIRKSYKKSDLAIIALSSSQDSETTALFLKHGANDYIKKDFSKEEFTCRIHNTIEALENIHIITNQSSRDFLTGAYNRRHFYKEMQPYFAQNHNGGERFAVAMIAIDDFKRLSDTYGYESAERAIVLLGEILRSSTNYRDVVARFSGEEFCVVLKNINSYSALDIFGRIRELVQESSFIAANGELVRFSVSIGIALTHDETLEESINQADMNLFNARQSAPGSILHT